MKQGIDVHTIKIICHENKEELHYLVYMCFQISKRTNAKGKNRGRLQRYSMHHIYFVSRKY